MCHLRIMLTVSIHKWERACRADDHAAPGLHCRPTADASLQDVRRPHGGMRIRTSQHDNQGCCARLNSAHTLHLWWLTQ